MDHGRALEYIQDFNDGNYLGYSDWRPPTLEELFSLLENQKAPVLHISPLFSSQQQYCWSSNISVNLYNWGMMFNAGIAYNFMATFYVRAVRTADKGDL